MSLIIEAALYREAVILHVTLVELIHPLYGGNPLGLMLTSNDIHIYCSCNI
jgi:hypothetical protein